MIHHRDTETQRRDEKDHRQIILDNSFKVFSVSPCFCGELLALKFNLTRYAARKRLLLKRSASSSHVRARVKPVSAASFDNPSRSYL
jgi:hypothetical protein